MKPENIVNALNDMDYDMIEEAEMEKKILIPRLRGKKTVLIAAAVCLLLCGTAAAGVVWLKPDVSWGIDGSRLKNGSAHTLKTEGYIHLPEDVAEEIVKHRDPERYNDSFLQFQSVEAWQEMFGIPFVCSSFLQIDSELYSRISSEEIDGEAQLTFMQTGMTVERTDMETDDREVYWKKCSMNVIAALSERAAREDSLHFGVLGDGTGFTEIMEYTSAAGIPYRIVRMTSDENDPLVSLYLYYAYESVIYQISVEASIYTEDIVIADLERIVDTLQIIYPAE